MKSLTIRFSDFGGPEVLEAHALPLATPAPGEIQIRHLAIGVNFIDSYHRRGIFGPPLALPSALGVEGVGEIIGVGAEVAGFVLGQRVAYVGGPPGAYATHRNLPAARALAVPDSVDDVTAAALTFKGLTAEYLVRRCYPVQQGDTVLFHAAAGGVGLLACQWLRQIGATVIGTVGSAEKARIAIENGCDHAILYRDEDVAVRVKELTGGRGVDVVYDSVGASTFEGSLNSLRPRGALVSFGESSGPVPPLSIGTLGAKGSLFLTRPSIAHYTAARPEFEAAAASLFAAIADKTLRAGPITTYPLIEAATAHRDLEARKTAGSVVLLP